MCNGEGWVFECQPRQIYVVKTGSASGQLHCQTLGNRSECHGSSEPSPWVPSISQNLQPFTGNDDVSIWVKNSRVGPQTNKQTNKMCISKILQCIYLWIYIVDSEGVDKKICLYIELNCYCYLIRFNIH